MPIKLHCPACGKKMEAPDSAGGKWGKCPGCHNKVYVPLPQADDDELKVAPLDETELQKQQRLMAETYQLTREILSEQAAPEAPPAPGGPASDITEEKLTEYIVTYLRQMVDGRLDEAQRTAERIVPHRRKAVVILDQFAKSPAAKDAPAVAAAIASARPNLVSAIRGDPGALAHRELRYARALEAGVYEVTLLDAAEKELEKVLYARNVDPAEGDLALAVGDGGTATPDQRRQAIGQAFGLEEFRYEHPIGEAQKLQDLQAEPEKEYWIWALSAMLVLMALEIFLAQRFGHYTTSGPGNDKRGLAQGPGSPSTR